MAHKTLVGGTAYEISGGKTLVGGTAFSIKNGKTLVGGTAYEVGFESFTPIFEIGSMTFKYNQFMKIYPAEISSNSPFGDLSAVNAVKIGEEIIPLPYNRHSDADYIFENFSRGVSAPKADGEYSVIVDRTTSYGTYYLQVLSFTDKGTCDVVLGSI